MKPKYLFPSDYMADPSANVFNGRLYIYPSHDWEAGAAFDDDGGHFQMKDYHVLSWDDVENDDATDHGVILDVKDVPWAEKQMWDNDCVEKDGKYYLIFSAKSYDGVGGQLQWWHPLPNGLAPVVGKYGEENGLIDLGAAPDHKGELFTQADSPAINSCVVRMSDDVQQFAEAPRNVVVLNENGEPMKAGDPHRFFEASWMHKYNGKYYFSYSTGDSHFLCYAIGDNPYGPFRYQGVILDPVVGWTTHHSIVEYKGQWYLCYHDCVPSNDITHLRSLKIQRLFYNADGTIQKVVNE